VRLGQSPERLVLLACALTAVAVAWTGRVSDGRRALAECDAAIERGDRFEAVMSARAAAEARCPLCAAPEQGFARLERIAKDAEGRGDDATAHAAWRATRAALLATAGLQTRGDAREHAEREIARFGQRLAAAGAADTTSTTSTTPAPGTTPGSASGPPEAASEARLRASLAERDVPSGWTAALLGAGGLLFVYAAARFASARGARVDLAIATAGAAIAVAGALLF